MANKTIAEVLIKAQQFEDNDKFEENMDDIGDEFWEQDFVKESGITRENYIEFANDGYIEIGGCPMDWEYV